jgi:hypothetical protein
MTSSAVPFIVFGAKSFQFPSVAKLPNAVRISLPTSLESQVLASCMVYFGWVRSCTSNFLKFVEMIASS